LYNDVYETKDGLWAGTFAEDDYKHIGNKDTKIKPVKIAFKEPVFYALKKTVVDNDGKVHDIEWTFPEPYFKRNGDNAVAVYGNYVEELFVLKRDGYLTARKVFKNGNLIQ
jgi:hypothetical protein